MSCDWNGDLIQNHGTLGFLYDYFVKMDGKHFSFLEQFVYIFVKEIFRVYKTQIAVKRINGVAQAVMHTNIRGVCQKR